MSKAKIHSPPLSDEEIRDVKKALKEKRGRVFKTAQEAIEDLHKSVANS
ncbi:hypothetical protein [Candidatus Nitrosotenuis cloacae]|nr:hypothetical protein [Candidatus Nitrosotenuis cloacae]